MYLLIVCLFRFGRKTAILILETGFVVSSLTSAFSPDYAVYAILRVFVGMFYISGYIAAFTYGKIAYYTLHIFIYFYVT